MVCDFDKLSGSKILITGVAGFIGTALCKKLLEQLNDADIVGIDNLNDYYDVKLKIYRLEELKEFDNFTFYKTDIGSKEELQSIFEKHKPQIVVNLAAQAGVRESITNPDIYIQSNVVGFFNVLDISKLYNVQHLIYASSSSVYGLNNEEPCSVTDNVDKPVSLYAATKKSDELMAHVYSNMYNFPTTGLRFFTVYGPAGRPDMACFSFTEKLKQGKNIQLFNYGKCKRDFTYIDDIVEGIIRVILNPPVVYDKEAENYKIPYRVYNIGNSSPVNLMDFVEILSEELTNAGVLSKDHDVKKHIEFLPMQPGDVVATYADTRSFEKDFDFKPGTDIREGLRSFAKWYKLYRCE